jgi:hypothetical protein
MWLYEGKEFTSVDIPDKIVGFVYQITDLENGMKYLGKKTLFNTKTLPPLKGQKKKRKKVTESDWQDYYGSNEKIKALVVSEGRDRFKREILKLCRSSSEATYWEAKLQFQFDVLLDPLYYNDYIMVRVSGSHMRALKD